MGDDDTAPGASVGECPECGGPAVRGACVLAACDGRIDGVDADE